VAINLGCGHKLVSIFVHFICGKYQAQQQQQLQLQMQLPQSNNVNNNGQLCVIIRVQVQPATAIDHLRFSTHLNRLWHLQSRRKQRQHQQQPAARSQIKMQFRSSTPWSICRCGFCFSANPANDGCMSLGNLSIRQAN